MKIIIATGGTGGHIIPALKVADALKSKGHELLLVGSFGSWLERVKKLGIPIEELSARGVIFSSGRKLWEALVGMAKSIFCSFSILKRFAPEVVVGFGGYGAFPIVFSATLLRYPTLIHEQNVVPGRANAILGKMVKRIAMSFKESERYFGSEKTIVTGCPCNVDPALLEHRPLYLKQFNFEEERITILILGGSQGSHKINMEAIKTIRDLSKTYRLQVIHICGKVDYDVLLSEYRQMSVPFKLFDFYEEMVKAYGVADIVIARAGALTVAEIVLAGIPAILIPYPYAGGHQRENARVLANTYAAQIIEEKNFDKNILKQAVKEMLNQKIDREELRRRGRSLVVERAVPHLVEEIVQLKK